MIKLKNFYFKILIYYYLILIMSIDEFDKILNKDFNSLKKYNQEKKIQKEKMAIISKNINEIKKNKLREKFNFNKYNNTKNFKNFFKDDINDEKEEEKNLVKKKESNLLLEIENKNQPIKLKSNLKLSILSKNNIKTNNKKVIINKIKNINKNNKIYKNLNEKIISIRIKLNPVKNNNFNLNNSNNYFYNTEKNSFKFLLNNFNSNFLTLRKSLDIFNRQEINNKNSIKGKNPLLKSHTMLNNRNFINDINENENGYVSKYFLPSSGFGLFSKEKKKI